jgi:hypothetical protein
LFIQAFYSALERSSLALLPKKVLEERATFIRQHAGPNLRPVV